MEIGPELRFVIANKLKEEFDCDHNDNPESPYYNSWIDTTDYGASDITSSFYGKINDIGRKVAQIHFSFRNVSEDYAIEWTKSFMEKHNLAYCGYEVDISEKGWFDVTVDITLGALLDKYDLWDEYKTYMTRFE